MTACEIYLVRYMNLLYGFLSAFLAVFFICAFVIRYQHLHANFTMDHDFAGVQKFHNTPTPRVGGLPLMIGLLIAAVSHWWFGGDEPYGYLLILICSLPVFFAGLFEDVTKKVSPGKRLLAAFLSALFGVILINAKLSVFGFEIIDAMIAYVPWIGVVLTIFAVGGVCHAINIIDGYNGLMTGVSILFCFAFSFVAYSVGDEFLFHFSIVLGGAICGFFVWNFPKGRIFAGDAGAYLIGFLLAELAVLLVSRNAGEVSPWFPLLLLIYPIFETIFSIYRKKYLRNMSPGFPDGLHFHMLIYKRIMRVKPMHLGGNYLLKKNSMTSPYLWMLSLLTVIPSVLFWDNERVLKIFCLIFVVFYTWLYRRIVLFKSPKWLIYKNLPCEKIK